METNSHNTLPRGLLEAGAQLPRGPSPWEKPRWSTADPPSTLRAGPCSSQPAPKQGCADPAPPTGLEVLRPPRVSVAGRGVKARGRHTLERVDARQQASRRGGPALGWWEARGRAVVVRVHALMPMRAFIPQ